MRRIINIVLLTISIFFVFTGVTYVSDMRSNGTINCIDSTSAKKFTKERMDLTDSVPIINSTVEFINPTQESIEVLAITPTTPDSPGMEDFLDAMTVGSGLYYTKFFITSDQGTFWWGADAFGTWTLGRNFSIHAKIPGLETGTTYTNVQAGYVIDEFGTIKASAYFANDVSTSTFDDSWHAGFPSDGDFNGDGEPEVFAIPNGTEAHSQTQFTTIGSAPTVTPDIVTYDKRNNELSYIYSITSSSSITSLNINIVDINEPSNTFKYDVDVTSIVNGVNTTVIDYYDVEFYETSIHSSIEVKYVDPVDSTNKTTIVEYDREVEIGPEPTLEPKVFTMHPKFFAGIAIIIVIVMLLLVIIL